MDIALAVVRDISSLPAPLLYLVIVVWLIGESAAVPLPNEAILLFSGFLAAAGHLDIRIAWSASVVGTLGGASLAWWIARTYGPPGVRRVGRYVFLSETRLAVAEGFFRRRGALTVFIARLTPVVRTVISYPAGLAGMPYRPFLLSTMVGSMIWNAAMLLLGRAAGAHWSDLFLRYHTPAVAAGMVLVLAAVAYGLIERQLRKRFGQPVA